MSKNTEKFQKIAWVSPDLVWIPIIDVLVRVLVSPCRDDPQAPRRQESQDPVWAPDPGMEPGHQHCRAFLIFKLKARFPSKT